LALGASGRRSSQQEQPKKKQKYPGEESDNEEGDMSKSSLSTDKQVSRQNEQNPIMAIFSRSRLNFKFFKLLTLSYQFMAFRADAAELN